MFERTAKLFFAFLILLPVSAYSGDGRSSDPTLDPLSVRPADRVMAPPDDGQRVVLHRNVYPLATPENMVGEVPSDQPMENMVLVLRPDAAQEAALEELIRAQQDRGSRYYHQWLTPQEFGERFGVSSNDMLQLTNWLEVHGMKVRQIPASRRSIVFSGTSGQVEEAFHTQMRKYRVDGEMHIANATNPEIPVALAGVVKGIVSMHDFRSKPAHTSVPAYTASNGAHFLMPHDWATIYDVLPLYSQGLTGSGQSIAVVGRTDISLTDVATFRSNAGLPAHPPQKIFVNGVNPGMPDCVDEAESALDVEWAGAIARDASIDFVSAQSGATDGIVLAAQYAITNNVAPIVTVSYLSCEAGYSDGGQGLWGSLWAEAASQGQSVFVASGDSGAAGCDLCTETVATQGKSVNAICSSPNSTCVGGTEFNDNLNPSAYWTATNGTGMSSVLSYIPELAWNESSWSASLAASGGGGSTVYAKPAWQAGPGVPADGMRDVPDVAMDAAIHDAYVIEIQGGAFYIAGTSASTPSFASVMALVLQNTGERQGNANPALYRLASQQDTAAGPAIFHDITSGNNSVPGLTGYNVGAGYDRVTGLGSVDAFLLVNNWNNISTASFGLAASPSVLTVAPGTPKTATLSMTVQGGFGSSVTLLTGALPAGVSVNFSSLSVSSTAPVTVTVSAGSSAVAGSFPIIITGAGGGSMKTVEISVAVAAPSFSLSTTPTGASIAVGASTSFAIAISRLNGFSSSVSLAATGLPSGFSAKFNPASITAGTSSSTLTILIASGTPAGVSVIGITATGGGVTETASLTISVVTPNLTLGASATSASIPAGGSAHLTLTTAGGAGFNSEVALSITGLPSGVTASLLPATIAAPGAGASSVTLSVATTAAAGTHTLTLSAVGGGISKTQSFNLTITPAPAFTLSPATATLSLYPGISSAVGFTVAGGNGFDSAVSFSVGGVPSGVTATFSPATIKAPGSGPSVLTLTVGATAKAGIFPLSVTATGGGLTKSATVTLTVLPAFTLKVSPASASVARRASTQITVTTTAGSGFKSSVALAVAGLPTGITASFNHPTLSSPGNGSSTLTLSVALSKAVGSYSFSVTATGGGVTRTQSLTVKVI